MFNCFKPKSTLINLLSTQRTTINHLYSIIEEKEDDLLDYELRLQHANERIFKQCKIIDNYKELLFGKDGVNENHIDIKV